MISEPDGQAGADPFIESELAVALAHELRNPITTLLNLIYLLENQFDSRHLAMMKKQVILCESIIGNLLNYQRTRQPSPESIDLRESAREVVSLLMIPSSIRLEMQDRAEGKKALVDPVHLRQVLINLIQNAVEAIGEQSGVITIEIFPDHSWMRVDLSDTGPGIRENLAVFQPFVTTKRTGLGLGLVLSKRLIEANRGTIELSTSPGHGCRFSIYLPQS